MKGGLCFIFFLLLTVFSCTDRDQVPSDIIGPDSMRVIMHDLIIADQFVSQYLVKDSLKRNVNKESQELYEKLFAVHKTTRNDFRKSLDYYSTRPDLEKKIFDSLSGTVSKERALIYKEKYGSRDSLAKRTADSVARLRAGSPPLNPDSLKRIILLAHPGLPMPVLLDSVHRRIKIHATADSLRLAMHIRDSATRHKTDSVRMKKLSDSLKKARAVHPTPRTGPFKIPK